MMKTQSKLWKEAGYTHIISWQEKHADYGVVYKYFPTTEDALYEHVKSVTHNDNMISFMVETI